MRYRTILKTAIFVAFLTVAGAMLGVACSQVYRQYEVFFLLGPEALNLAIWVLGAMGLVIMAAGLVVALVRPFRVIVAGFVLSGLAMLLAWEISILPEVLGLLYVAQATMYARFVVGELNNRINFSTRPLREGQATLQLALILLVSISFASGYREDAKSQGFIVPPAFKGITREMIASRLVIPEVGLRELSPEEKAAALEQIEQMTEKLWVDIEKMLQPYAEFIPIGLALMLIWMLETLLGFVSWIPSLLLGGIFPLLRLLRVARVVTETRETRQLTLA